MISKIVQINKCELMEGEGSSKNKECITALDKFLKSSGKIVPNASLPHIYINEVSETVSTTKIQPAQELSAKNSGRTSRPRSAKEDTKSTAKGRDTSKNYIIHFNFVFIMIMISIINIIVLIFIIMIMINIIITNIVYYIYPFYFYYYSLGTSKTRRNHGSPSRESTDEENMEVFSTPDRSAANLKKNSGKSTLKGIIYIYDYYIGVCLI
jgi:hypothetical protein